MKKFMQTYMELDELKKTVEVKILTLRAQAESLSPTLRGEELDNLGIEIESYSRYLGRITSIMAEFNNRMIRFSLTYNRRECEIFSMLYVQKKSIGYIAKIMNLTSSRIRHMKMEFDRQIEESKLFDYDMEIIKNNDDSTMIA